MEGSGLKSGLRKLERREDLHQVDSEQDIEFLHAKNLREDAGASLGGGGVGGFGLGSRLSFCQLSQEVDGSVGRCRL